jgi:hypothetical protein
LNGSPRAKATIIPNRRASGGPIQGVKQNRMIIINSALFTIRALKTIVTVRTFPRTYRFGEDLPIPKKYSP